MKPPPKPETPPLRPLLLLSQNVPSACASAVLPHAASLESSSHSAVSEKRPAQWHSHSRPSSPAPQPGCESTTQPPPCSPNKPRLRRNSQTSTARRCSQSAHTLPPPSLRQISG